MKKTVIDELIEKCIQCKDMFEGNTRKEVEIRRTYENVIMIAKRLKEKEKQQIIEAYRKALTDTNMDELTSIEICNNEAEHYYNKNFNQ